MKPIYLIFAVFLGSMILSGCDEDKVTGARTGLVEVRVDLVSGLQGNKVRVLFNEAIYFQADLTESVPFSGPVAVFTTSLPRGTNQCEVNWRDGGLPYNTYTQDINLGDADIYYVYIMASNDSTLVVNVLENPLGYQ